MKNNVEDAFGYLIIYITRHLSNLRFVGTLMAKAQIAMLIKHNGASSKT